MNAITGYPQYDPDQFPVTQGDPYVALNDVYQFGLNWMRVDEVRGLARMDFISWFGYTILYYLGLSNQADSNHVQYQYLRVLRQVALSGAMASQWVEAIKKQNLPKNCLPEVKEACANPLHISNIQGLTRNCHFRLMDEGLLSPPWVLRMFYNQPTVQVSGPEVLYEETGQSEGPQYQSQRVMELEQLGLTQPQKSPVQSLEEMGLTTANLTQQPKVPPEIRYMRNPTIGGQQTPLNQGYQAPSYQYPHPGSFSLPRSTSQQFTTHGMRQGMERLYSTKEFLDFYRGAIPNNRGVFIHDIWKRGFGELERDHFFIQWLFPTDSRGANSTACVYDFPMLQAFFTDGDLHQRALTSFQVMLNFYGFDFDPTTRQIQDRKQMKTWWTGIEAHNLLRVTRIMRFMSAIGEEALARDFLSKLLPYSASKIFNGIPDSSINDHWKPACGIYS